MPKKVRSFYVDIDLWNEFLGSASVRGKRQATKLSGSFKRIMETHRAGNPQLLMTHYIEIENLTL